MATPDDTLIIVDNDVEQRAYYSPATATNGIFGHLFHNYRRGRVLVYRLDEEASTTLTAEAHRALDADPPRYSSVATGPLGGQQKITMTGGQTAKARIRDLIKRVWR